MKATDARAEIIAKDFIGRVFPMMVLLLVSMTNAEAAKIPPLFPLQDGNVWILQADTGEQRIVTCEAGTNKFLQVTGLSDRDVTFLGKTASSKLLRWDVSKHKVKRTVALRPRRKGRSIFSIGQAPCDPLLLQLVPMDTVLHTATGDYMDCSVLWITTADETLAACRSVLLERVYFAPGVGPVVIQGKLDRFYQLIAAQVGDNVILSDTNPNAYDLLLQYTSGLSQSPTTRANGQ